MKTVIISAIIAFVAFYLLFLVVEANKKDKLDTNSSSEIVNEDTGCTAPDEPGCSQCLVVADEGCTILEWTGSEDSEVEPWYNSQSVSECNVDIKECSSCLKRDKQDLNRIIATQGFNAEACKEISSDLVDPCFAPQSTECLCTKYNAYVQACGE